MNQKEVIIKLPDGKELHVNAENVFVILQQLQGQTISVKEEENPVFSEDDCNILRLSKREIREIEAFFKEHKCLYNWHRKEVTTTICSSEPRNTTMVYVDNYGNIFQDLRSVGEYYQEDVEYIAQNYSDRIEIKQFNSEDGKIFWHLNFDSHRGRKISIVSDYRSSVCIDHGVKDWENIKDTDTSTWGANPRMGYKAITFAVKYSQQLHRFFRWAHLMKAAREHVDDPRVANY